MEDTGQVLTATLAVPIQETVELAGETFGSAFEPIVESADMDSFAEIPTEDLSEEGYNPFSVEEVVNEDNFNADVSEEERMVQAREELEEIKKDAEEPGPEKNNGNEEQLATLNETIRLLEIQRDALKEQLGGGLITFFAELTDNFFAETLINEPSFVENNPLGQPSEVWKEDARYQLRKIERKISELKQIRNRLVANN